MSMMQKLLEINDEAVRLRAERDELRSENKKLQDICADGGRRITELQAELDAARRDLQSSCAGYSTATTLPPKPAGSGLLRDVSHYTEAAEVDTPDTDDEPAEPQPVQTQEVTLSAYVVGDTVSPGALRIVWATEEWIKQSQFGIVHAMKDVMFLDHDRFTPEQFSLTLMLNKQ